MLLSFPTDIHSAKKEMPDFLKRSQLQQKILCTRSLHRHFVGKDLPHPTKEHHRSWRNLSFQPDQQHPSQQDKQNRMKKLIPRIQCTMWL